MKKQKLFIAILVGLTAGHILAENDRPFSIINTLRVGYDDNVYRTSANEEESAYIADIIELAFRAALSDRTDLTFKSQFVYRSDDDENNFYPNLYAILTHSVSPRLLLELSNKVQSNSKTTSAVPGKYNYVYNTLSFVPSYVLSSKDSLSAPMSYKVKRNESSIDTEDTDLFSAGLTWKRQLTPQRTWAALNLRHTMVDYINRDSENNITLASAQILHTFNPQWQANLAAGGTYNESDFSRGGVNVKSDNVNPYLSAGLTFAPSPVTRFTANVSQQYQESDTSLYAGQEATSFTLGAQHDFTAKIMGKLTASYVDSDYDSSEFEQLLGIADRSEEYIDVGVRFQYKLNRNNSLELGVRHREKMYDNIANRDWEQNLVDVGWRLEL